MERKLIYSMERKLIYSMEFLSLHVSSLSLYTHCSLAASLQAILGLPPFCIQLQYERDEQLFIGSSFRFLLISKVSDHKTLKGREEAGPHILLFICKPTPQIASKFAASFIFTCHGKI
ncbi:hypothetical protein AVEN_111615-1 [Araneus ventricosus]|uniref:Uncharacterized protein n=1 Tax=Araneus ventricosus TaxID=182803 RepID=A0A4Y2C212_ARAVE|nr:hypothetical protein AVEN_111615-1 [Araneus ventricosus]